MSLENTKYCPSCDGKQAIQFCTCSRPSSINSQKAAGQNLMIECSTCNRKVLEVVKFTTKCEPCFKQFTVQPLVDMRAALLKSLEEVDEKLRIALGQLTRSSLHTYGAQKCNCGRSWSSGLDLLNHLPDCQGPTRKESKVTTFIKKTLADDLTEMG